MGVPLVVVAAWFFYVLPLFTTHVVRYVKPTISQIVPCRSWGRSWGQPPAQELSHWRGQGPQEFGPLQARMMLQRGWNALGRQTDSSQQGLMQRFKMPEFAAETSRATAPWHVYRVLADRVLERSYV